MRIELSRAQVPAGESWARAADRRTPGVTGPVLAHDLSGDPLVFRVEPDWRLAVRPMSAADLPLLSRWVSQPHAAKWWDEHRSVEQLRAHYGPALAGSDPTRLWIWELNGRSVGFAQDYLISDHPEFALLSGRPDAVGFDYLLGEAGLVDRGLGTAFLWVFLRDIVVPAYPGVTEVFAAPDHRNLRSRRVLAKLGAVEGLWFDEPSGSGVPSTVVGSSIEVNSVLR